MNYSITAPRKRIVRSRLIASQAIALLAMTFAVGCASGGPLSAWKKQVERAVRVNGAADFGQLYRFANDTAQSPSGIIAVRALDIEAGGPWPFVSRYDVVGVLIGMDRQAKNPGYAFLVGMVKLDRSNVGKDRADHDLADIRLAFASESDNQIRWNISQENEEARSKYDSYRRAPDAGLTLYPFPNGADRYQLKRIGAELICVEERSGATWKVITGN